MGKARPPKGPRNVKKSIALESVAQQEDADSLKR